MFKKNKTKTVDTFYSFLYCIITLRNRFRAEILERPIRDDKKVSFFHINNRIHFIDPYLRVQRGRGEALHDKYPSIKHPRSRVLLAEPGTVVGERSHKSFRVANRDETMTNQFAMDQLQRKEKKKWKKWISTSWQLLPRTAT